MHNLSAIELRNKFVKGELKAREIVQHFLNRIEKYDPQIGAFLSVFPESALAHADALDKKRTENKPLGKLAGVPIALKDNIHKKNEISTCGSKFLENYRAPFDSTVVRLLEAEDAIMIGKANCDEFAMGSSTEHSAYKITRNPWNLACIPGGSSGGSAAAVSAGLVPLALGSDTGGSIRQPAAMCGIVGFKPTYGRVSRYGLVAYGSSLDQIGPMTRTVSDAALMMEVIGQHCEKDSTSIQEPAEEYLKRFDKNIKGLKIGVPWGFLEGLNEVASNSFHQSIEALKSMGAEIVSVDLSLLKYSIAVYYILATAEASTNLARFDGIRYGKRAPEAKTLDEVYELSKEQGFGPEVKMRILLGTYVLSAGYQDAYYKKAQKVRALIIQQFQQAYKQCNLIATPVSPYPAFEIGSVQDPLQMYLADIYTIAGNLAGVPAISIQSGFSPDKKPLGLQLIGPQKKDVDVLKAAFAFEQNQGFYKATPESFK